MGNSIGPISLGHSAWWKVTFVFIRLKIFPPPPLQTPLFKGSFAICHPFYSLGVLFHLIGRQEHISFWYISLFLYNDFMFEYYIIFPSFSLNDIYWIYVFVYIYYQFQKQADLLLYFTGRCFCWSCLYYHHCIIGFDVMVLLLSFRAIWNFEVRHK